jgi:hypothetical protein
MRPKRSLEPLRKKRLNCFLVSGKKRKIKIIRSIHNLRVLEPMFIQRQPTTAEKSLHAKDEDRWVALREDLQKVLGLWDAQLESQKVLILRIDRTQVEGGEGKFGSTEQTIKAIISAHQGFITSYRYEYKPDPRLHKDVQDLSKASGASHSIDQASKKRERPYRQENPRNRNRNRNRMFGPETAI